MRLNLFFIISVLKAGVPQEDFIKVFPLKKEGSP